MLCLILGYTKEILCSMLLLIHELYTYPNNDDNHTLRDSGSQSHMNHDFASVPHLGISASAESGLLDSIRINSTRITPA